MNEKSKFENLFILICGIITGILIYYNYQEPQIKEGISGISSEIYNSGQTNVTQREEKSIQKPDLIAPRSKTSVNKSGTGSIKPTDSKSIKSVQMMPNDTYIKLKGFNTGDFANTIMNYARKISSGNLDFILTLLAENGGVDMYKQSNVVVNGVREQSYGYCQLNRKWHYKVVDDKRFWSDPYWQMDRCWEKYKLGTKFYGYFNRLKLKDRVIIYKK